MNAHDHGACPHCGRADAVRVRDDKHEVYNHAEFQRFECGGCGARWTGVRRPGQGRGRIPRPGRRAA